MVEKDGSVEGKITPKASRFGKISTRGLTDYLKENESLILLVSVTISSISAIISAAALYYTASQVSLLDRERLTPYKVTLFNQRLDGVRDTFAAISEFEMEALCGVRASRFHVFGNKMRKSDLEELKNCQKAAGDAVSKLSVGIRKNAMLWPKKSRIQLGEYLETASRLPGCVATEPFKDATEAPVELGQLYQKNCPLGFKKYWEDIRLIVNSLQLDAGEMVDSGDSNFGDPREVPGTWRN